MTKTRRWVNNSNNLPFFVQIFANLLISFCKRDHWKISLLVKVGIESGGGFLKICLSVFDMDNLVSGSKIGLSKKFKDSGVKTVFLVAAVPYVPENYQNVKKLWLNLGLQNLDRRFTIATDLKLCNILLGMISHNSCRPRWWCDVEKRDSKNHSFFEQSLLGLFWGKYQ